MKFFAAGLAILVSCSAFALPVPRPPALKARSYALLDYASGQILAAKDPDLEIEPASLAKLMTLYVAFDQLRSGQIKLGDNALVSEKAWRSEGSRSFMEVGKRIPVETLLRGIIIQSGNDASIVLAEHIAGTEDVFADLMNQYARKLGLTHSHFTNATGLPHPELHTSARDMALMSRALIQDFPEWYALFKEKEFVFNKIRQPNRNLLLWRDESVDGIKTGHTESAGFSLAVSAQRDGRRLIGVVIGTGSEQSRADASLALLNYGFRFFEVAAAIGSEQPLTTIRAWKGTETELALGVAAPVQVSVPRGSAGKVQIKLQVNEPVFAPVALHQAVGRVDVMLDQEVLRSEPLVALNELPRGSLWRRLWDSLVLWIKGLLA
jgi:D-alanyl-D-alanine carboxypeptidase (penicillin-binding protein 5/6)